MTTSKVAISMPSEVLSLAKRKVRAGRAKSLSAFVSEAVDEKLQREDLADILAAMDNEHGKPDAASEKWAKRIVRRSSSMRAR
jgi:Arc/MetJ-type ribon-helix-helix transcriptional regulator